MKIFYRVPLLVIAGISYVVYPILRAKQIDRKLVPDSMPFSVQDESRTRYILILGDSTAVGVGTKPEESIAARLASSLHANVENHARSGAVTADLAGQIQAAQRDHYDLVEIQIGANDIIGMRNLDAASVSLDAAFTSLSLKSKRIIFLTAGDIGTSPIFHWPLSILMSHRSRYLREKFMQVAQKHEAEYVDIYTALDIFASDPDRYHAADGLHLNAEGYGYWYELILKSLTKWSELESTHT